MEEIDLRIDKSQDYPDFIKKLEKFMKDNKCQFKGQDSLLISGNIDNNGIFLTAGKAISQVSWLAQVMGIKDEVRDLIITAVSYFLEDKDMTFVCTIFNDIMKYILVDPELKALFEKEMITFISISESFKSKKSDVN